MSATAVDSYYLLREGSEKEEGPYTLDQIRHLYYLGKLEGPILCASEGMAEWQPISALISSPEQSSGSSGSTEPPISASQKFEPEPKLIACPDCGHQVSKRAASCPSCGAPINQDGPLVAVSPSSSQVIYVSQPKSRGVYIILGIFFGLLGIHNFYAGHYGAGAIQFVLTLLGLAIIVPLIFVFVWVIVELFVVTKDGSGRSMT
ncbi:MAG TPA: NINE protein [Verrucomicrobiae bacterium]|jgi:TM2 domain-containing membrane protein YozV|nr:NINE protein [Verrucomicrobiae bacterium]